METPGKEKTDGVAKWFFKKLVTTPASWLGLAAGIAVGIPVAGVSGPVAGICFGAIVSFAGIGSRSGCRDSDCRSQRTGGEGAMKT